GEPEEDAPILNIIHDGLLTPLGGGRRYGPETIATVYIARFGTDPRRGVERMRPRNYSCFAGSMAFYSTPSDLLRFGLANNAGGEADADARLRAEQSGAAEIEAETAEGGAVIAARTHSRIGHVMDADAHAEKEPIERASLRVVTQHRVGAAVFELVEEIPHRA